MRRYPIRCWFDFAINAIAHSLYIPKAIVLDECSKFPFLSFCSWIGNNNVSTFKKIHREKLEFDDTSEIFRFRNLTAKSWPCYAMTDPITLMMWPLMIVSTYHKNNWLANKMTMFGGLDFFEHRGKVTFTVKVTRYKMVEIAIFTTAKYSNHKKV